MGRICPQHVKSRMKLASSLGKYDEEWKEGDCATPPKGEVPCIAILFIHVSELLRAGSAETFVKGFQMTRISRAAAQLSVDANPSMTPIKSVEGPDRKIERNKERTNLLITNETAKGKTSPASASHEATSQALAAIAVDVVSVWIVHGNGLCAGADERVLAAAACGRRIK